MEEVKPAGRTEKVKALGEMLEGYARDLAEQMSTGKSEMMLRYLDFAARFHRYSFGNMMLILGQCPEATRVAGIRQWNRMGRRVRTGERGIMIFAPMAVWKKSDAASESASEDEMAERERNETREKITIFKAVYVWDQAQTDGDPLPEMEWASGDASRLLPTLREVIAESGIDLSEGETGSAHGFAYRDRIMLKEGLAEAHAAAVLIHEWCHVLRHFDGERRGKKIEETEADMTAYIVCRHFGIECNASDYLLSHASTPELLLERMEVVRSTAAGMIEKLEAAMLVDMTAEAV